MRTRAAHARTHAQILKGSARILRDAKAFARVHDEAAFQYSLRMHPNVVTVHGILRDEEAGLLGIVMERCSCALSDALYGPQKAARRGAGPCHQARTSCCRCVHGAYERRGQLSSVCAHLGSRADHVRADCAPLAHPSTHTCGPQGWWVPGASDGSAPDRSSPSLHASRAGAEHSRLG